MGRHHDVDEIELEQAESPDGVAEVGRIDWAGGPRAVEALRRQRETARLSLGKIVAGHFAPSVLNQVERASTPAFDLSPSRLSGKRQECLRVSAQRLDGPPGRFSPTAQANVKRHKRSATTTLINVWPLRRRTSWRKTGPTPPPCRRSTTCARRSRPTTTCGTPTAGPRPARPPTAAAGCRWQCRSLDVSELPFNDEDRGIASPVFARLLDADFLLGEARIADQDVRGPYHANTSFARALLNFRRLLVVSLASAWRPPTGSRRTRHRNPCPPRVPGPRPMTMKPSLAGCCSTGMFICFSSCP